MCKEKIKYRGRGKKCAIRVCYGGFLVSLLNGDSNEFSDNIDYKCKNKQKKTVL